MNRKLLIACAALATAGGPAHGSDGFWDQAEPNQALSEREQLIAQGTDAGDLARTFQREAFEARRDNDLRRNRDARSSMRESGEHAILLLEKALEMSPNDANLHYALGEYYYEFLYSYYEDDLPMATKMNATGKKAIAHWDAFDRLAPTDPRRVNAFRGWSPRGFSGQTYQLRTPYQFKRSIIYTKLGGEENYKKSLAEYEYCIEISPSGQTTTGWFAQLLSNSAEILMALGRLDQAVERYRDSIEYESDPLYYYGLAVALDRQGQTESALEYMRLGRSYEHSPLSALARDSVFFIPMGDVHYYYALGYEAAGDTKEAIKHYRAFLRTAIDSRYRSRAQQHIDYLERPAARKRR